MLENCKTAHERWGGVSEIIDRWLLSRQSLLVSFCALPAKQEAAAEDSEAGEKLRLLCQRLMDYISAGHFEVYDQLLREGKEFGDTQGLEQAQELYKEIDSTTDLAVDFNDKYQETDDLDTLVQDLSQLGEALETRFRAEDQMIATLHTAHKSPSSS